MWRMTLLMLDLLGWSMHVPIGIICCIVKVLLIELGMVVIHSGTLKEISLNLAIGL